MQVLVFVTQGEDGNATGPTLFLLDKPEAALPPHPRSLEWRYFATVEDRDQMVPMGALEAIEQQGRYVANRMI